ncbi:mRNA-binding protein PUF3 KNAG_0H02550 [Huiozyma naganishii CBS 8797]|uniref:Pumilio homology domain family member 3 n=1 Tax=Huiozyma naganishii (strain ATCC MYA-139 / BCRC 22969 / CBS 8797 / KCTC 17520 / NBRC 10181 / NCYC 3082 / Yp74L-3) TaxID=1071383 RepID=J7R9W7_HUIN7|nr:hypothetical protein KNAG_0H02550 [Kazachstania naganishii CBS 8797]CCK71670.1 hypothetical protein KNAG_0H02550 [Kazachstania naganishii CBS 8797]
MNNISAGSNSNSSSNGNTKYGDMDVELASIVSSLSALSNSGSTSNSMGGGASGNGKQLGGFRRSSFNSSDADSDVGFANNNGNTFKNLSHSLGTAPPYASSFNQLLSSNGTTGASNNNNNNNYYYSSSASHAGNNSMKQRLGLLGSYPNSMAGPGPTFTISNGKDNNYAHTIQNITTGATGGGGMGSGGFFEAFGKSIIEGTRELENDDNVTVPSSHPGSQVTLDRGNISPAAFNSDDQHSGSDHTGSINSALSSHPKNIWNPASTETFKPGLEAFPQQQPQPQMVMKNGQYLVKQPMFQNGFPYNNGFQQFPMVPPPNSFIPMMMYQQGNDGVKDQAQENFVNTAPTPAEDNPATSPLSPTVLPVNTEDFDGSNPGSGNSPETLNILSPTNRGDSKGMVFVQGQDERNAEPFYYPTFNEDNRTSNNGKGAKLRKNSDHVNKHKGKHKGHNKNDKTNQLGANQANPYLDQAKYVRKNGFAATHKNDAPTLHHNDSESGTAKKQQSAQPAFHRSPLLEEIRSNSNNEEKTYHLADICGHTLEFCKDQYGSRFIQKELATASSSEKEVIFNEIRDDILTLSNDVFGNYVIQKFFEFGSKTQKDILIDNFSGKMKELSMQMYACRVIQKALEFIDADQRIELVKELSDCVLKMIKDQNGNHVIQKAIECIPIELLPFVLTSLTGHIYHLSTHSYGCRVVQRLLEFGSLQDKTVILLELKDFIPYLIQDQYGNYVIQHVLQHGSDDPDCLPMVSTKQEIIEIVSKNVVEFSKHKFASNVVEKAILYGTKEQKDSVISKILPKSKEHAANLEDNAPMILMMRDQFANYVVQKLVTVSEGEGKILIVIAIRAYLDKLNKSNSLGNRHLASVEKLAALVDTVEI